MKKLFLPCVAVLAALIFLGSCDMEKRHYRPGYHVEWNNHKNTTATHDDQTSVSQPEATTTTQAFQAPVTTPEATPAVQQAATPVAAPAVAVSHKSLRAFSAVAKSTSPASSTVSAEKATVKKATGKTTSKAPKNGPNKGLLIVLAIFIPWLAVGLATDWDVKPVVICILLGFLFCLPGIIYAIVVVNREA